MAKERTKAIINLVVAMGLLANAVLTAMGKNPLPFDESEMTEVLSYFLSVGATFYAWWKNNNLTVEAETGQKVLDELKANRGKVGQESDLNDPEAW